MGALIMLGWLLYPAARCTVSGWKEVEIARLDEDSSSISETDKDRVTEGLGFFGTLRETAVHCYGENALGQQAGWKKSVAGGLAGATVVFWLIGRATRPRPSRME